MTQRAFTGRTRQRRTRLRVIWADRIARLLITVGGLTTIVAVSFVAVFLAYVAVPLFRHESAALAERLPLPVLESGAPLLQLTPNEHMTALWALYGDGTLRVLRADDGTVVREQRLFEGRTPSASSVDPDAGYIAFGFADGAFQSGQIAFETAFVPTDQMPEALRSLPVAGPLAVHEGDVVQRASEDQYRVYRVTVQLNDPVLPDDPQPVARIDLSVQRDGPVLAMVTADGMLHAYRVSQRTNILTRQVTTTLSGGQLALPERAEHGLPIQVLLSGRADTVFAIWRDGYGVRVDSRNFDALSVAETLDLTPREGVALTQARFLVGKTSLVVGDSAGGVGVWFRTRPDGAGTVDGYTLVNAYDMPSAGAAVTALGVSGRKRMLAVGHADGVVRLFYVTNRELLDEGALAAGRPVELLSLSPRDDGLFGVGDGGVYRFGVDVEHPESNLRALFGTVWYEGFNEPQHIWQSSSGTDEFEPKFGLVPLIFGTIKATFYTMLFGLPLAILAAVYTSEFMHPRLKGVVKPTIEMMASLPSVVLGFLAALVFAPFIEDIVPQTIAVFVCVPFAFLLMAHLWQLLPEGTALRLARYRLLAYLLTVPLGLWLAALTGPLLERWLFAGDIKRWLDGQIGTATGGWLILFLPLTAALAGYGIVRWVNPYFRAVGGQWTRRRMAVAALARFFVAALAIVLGALALSALASALGLDARGHYLDTYSQRNALIVGFVMGFAIIPIIYTISEDALSSVPEHLRAGSLAAGATPWQTAVRVIIPTAASGIFSAAMIGFGRAVGETMIVLMAAGNTPIMDWNIFSGFRTLSANIAVELPEAVRDDTHYRVLFLAALTLFAMTFSVNTVAEVIRQRFRKRAYQL